ncbi:MAG: hypothetical protein H7A46_11045 [Verrucomicrobiales bacterium]|nr:hypothetical protein [Verrucomicrobiales bacterium]
MRPPIREGRGAFGRARAIAPPGCGAVPRAACRPELWLPLVALLLVPSASAVTVFSSTGQFVIHSPHASTTSLSLVAPDPVSGRVVLEPDSLAVGCERVKAALLAELGLPDRWQGKIHVKLRPTLSAAQVPVVSGSRFADGWYFALETPEELPPQELVRSLVMVLLLELADRTPGPNGAEVPLWLSEGLTAEVLARVGPDLVPPQTPVVARVGGSFGQLSSSSRLMVLSQTPTATEQQMLQRGEWGRGFEVRAANRVDARRRMRAEGALSFAELSLPAGDDLRGEAGRRYRDCAQAFLNQLRALPDGDRLLQQMLGGLTHCLNWQTAFVTTYRSHFPTLLDVEKWWALASHRYATVGVVDVWPAARAAGAMDGILSVILATTTGPGAVPVQERVSLTDAMTRLQLGEFVRVIGLKQRQLAVLLLHSPPAVAGLCQEYSSLFGLYLELCGQQSQADGGLLLPGRGQQELLERLAYSLERLDRQRRKLMTEIGGQAEVARASSGATVP